MANIFNTEYVHQHGGVLPGWIIGTAGALRYPLPPESKMASAAQTNVYGYLLANVKADGSIDFRFSEIGRKRYSHRCSRTLQTEIHSLVLREKFGRAGTIVADASQIQTRISPARNRAGHRKCTRGRRAVRRRNRKRWRNPHRRRQSRHYVK